MAVVALTGVSKSYFTDQVETRALRDITLTIDHGEYVAIEGPSGCGKSTLLSIIGLLDLPTLGCYRLNGIAVENLRRSERSRLRSRSVGFIFQNFNLIGDLSIEENVALPLAYAGMTKAARRERVIEVLDQVSMSHRALHYPTQLSGGEQQRVAVARAVATEPALLLADEPTGNLDTRNGEAIMALLLELNASGSTIVMVTHDPRFARQANRRVSLLDGQLLATAPTAEVH